uniref:Protein kinase domain-containing protein n=1 Tax=Scylla olivacea TaxID=85551 RepID=A0A0P4WER5_SCYOL
MMAEALVLQLLQSVAGVPRLYGVTDSPPQALVMTHCPGEQLEAFHTPRTARTFLASLQRASRILLRMHALGVSHGDVHQRNILVQAAGDTEQVTVHLVDFEESQIFNDEREKRLDALNLFNIARSYVLEINKHLYPGLHRRRHRLLQQQDASLDLSRVSVLLCNILHGCPCPDQPTSSLLPCRACSASEDSRES